MRVVEKFISINGEGDRAGELAVFIRFAGCNLDCGYCDTAWANEKDGPYEEMTPLEIAEYVASTGVCNVTLTGGEPLLQEDMPLLLQELLASGSLQVEIETNGSVPLRDFCGKYRPVFTLDYKLPGSGCEEHMCTDNFALIGREDTVKFVVGSRADLDRAREIIEAYGLTRHCRVYLSPVFGKIEPREIVEYMKEYTMNHVRLQLQIHKYIWEPDRRGV